MLHGETLSQTRTRSKNSNRNSTNSNNNKHGWREASQWKRGGGGKLPVSGGLIWRCDSDRDNSLLWARAWAKACESEVQKRVRQEPGFDSKYPAMVSALSALKEEQPESSLDCMKNPWLNLLQRRGSERWERALKEWWQSLLSKYIMYIVYVYSENLKCAYLKVKAETGNKRKSEKQCECGFQIMEIKFKSCDTSGLHGSLDQAEHWKDGLPKTYPWVKNIAIQHESPFSVVQLNMS